MISCTRRRFIVSAAAAVPLGGMLSAVDDLLLPGRAAAGALPDMIVTDIAGPSAMTAGQLVRFAATVKNQGTATTPAGLETGVAFRVNGVEVAWSGTVRSAIAAGASVTLQADQGGVGATGRWLATAGTHTIEAVVNDVDRYAEASRDNNKRTATFTVAAAAPTRPVNMTRPVITGTARVGDVLTSSTGTWS